MKAILLAAASLFTFASHAQDTIIIKQIDSLVAVINHSNYKTKRDTLKQDQPSMGLSMRTYLTTVVNGSELKKYVNHGLITNRENGITKQMTTSNAFYFDHNKLIKVEEFALGDDKKIMDAHWYYADNKPLYYTFQSDKSPARAEMLLTIATSMLAQGGFK